MLLGSGGDAPFVSGVVVCCQCHWESRPQEGGGIAQAWAAWPEGAPAPNGTMMCRGHGVPEMVTPAMRTTAVFARFFELDNDKFKIIITLRRALKFEDTGPYKNFDFLFNRLTVVKGAMLSKVLRTWNVIYTYGGPKQGIGTHDLLLHESVQIPLGATNETVLHLWCKSIVQCVLVGKKSWVYFGETLPTDPHPYNSICLFFFQPRSQHFTTSRNWHHHGLLFSSNLFQFFFSFGSGRTRYWWISIQELQNRLWSSNKSSCKTTSRCCHLARGFPWIFAHLLVNGQ